MIEITADSVKRGLTALVVEKGENFIYEQRPCDDREDTTCRYVWDDKPDCFIGQFLAREGVSLERLTEADQGAFQSGVPAGRLLEQLENEGVATVTPAALQMLRTAQLKQDCGKTWGVALAYAMEYYIS